MQSGQASAAFRLPPSGWVPDQSQSARRGYGASSSMHGKRPSRRNAVAFRRIVFASLATLILSANVSTAAEDGPAIGELLKTGWQIAGRQAFDNRSTFILFRHPEQNYLVQCRVGYDVTRTPSTYSICYELRSEMQGEGGAAATH